ncbi:MCE family protein [Gordonia sp. X0973]|uniref:MlaD family protein n=1 Tax=Gordonia sp. X0973 TaxID=2742602 RepID=UPI000F5270E9|nr:MlaD family protein [Gordonia sp. X0973]QKT08355.1 MCE family protein [Gordonia sp. X0973]
MTFFPTSRLSRAGRVTRVVAALGAVAAVASGCASFSVERLPAPGAGGDSWPLHIQFPTIMNLPADSKVTVNGLRSGVVSDIASARDYASVTLKLSPSTVVGRDASVELRQDTLLGDTYVAITNPADAYSNPLPHGATLGTDRVKPPVQIESLLNSLANFVGGGSLPQLGNTFDRVVQQFPADTAKTRQSTATIVGTLNALGDRTELLRAMMNSGSQLTSQIAQMEDQIRFVLSPQGLQLIDAATVPAQIVDLMGRLQGTLTPILPLVPVVKALVSIVERVVKPLLIPGWPDYFGQASNPQALLNVLTDRIIPFLKEGPAVNVNRLAIENDVSNSQLADMMLRQLRMMGLTR